MLFFTLESVAEDDGDSIVNGTERFLRLGQQIQVPGFLVWPAKESKKWGSATSQLHAGKIDSRVILHDMALHYTVLNGHRYGVSAFKI